MSPTGATLPLKWPHSRNISAGFFGATRPKPLRLGVFGIVWIGDGFRLNSVDVGFKDNARRLEVVGQWDDASYLWYQRAGLVGYLKGKPAEESIPCFTVLEEADEYDLWGGWFQTCKQLTKTFTLIVFPLLADELFRYSWIPSNSRGDQVGRLSFKVKNCQPQLNVII
jgi:hypothetical protein